MEFFSRLVVLVDRGVKEGFAATLDFVLVAKGLEETLPGTEVGY